MLIIAASFEPIFGSGVDMGEAIGEVSSPENASVGVSSGAGTGAGAAAERLPRINSINLSVGTAIKTPCAPFVTTYKLLVNRVGSILCQLPVDKSLRITCGFYGLYELYA
jgi:hypothetical protein